MAAPVVLVEASPRRIADGVIVPARLAGAGAMKPYRYPDAAGGIDRSWSGGIVTLPTMIASLEFDGTDLGTGGVPQAAEIVWAPSRSADLEPLAALFWHDAAIKVRIGPEGVSPPVTLAGKVLGASIAQGKLKLSLADPAAELKKPFPLARYAGTGDLEGPAEWEGKLKRRVWGRVWNLPGEPIDPANNIYAFADPTRPLGAIDAVRDSGAAAAALVPQGWQGSIGATLASLRASVPPQGGGVVCPSLGCVKWWTEPGGLHADLRGEIGTGYVETSASIAQALVAARPGPSFAADTVSDADLARPAPVGWVVRDETTTIAAMLDELLGNVSLLWLLDPAGEIAIRQWAWGASTVTARSEEVNRLEQLRPVHTRRIGYRRNEQPMARGDIAAIVLASDAVYADGTPIEALKPAEPGATLGAPAGTPVGDRPAEDVTGAIDQHEAAINQHEAALAQAEIDIIAAEEAIVDARADADAAFADADTRIAAARARADAAFTEIGEEALRLDVRIDTVIAEGGYDDTAIYAAVSQVDQAAVGRDLALADRATNIEASVDDAEARIALTETALVDGRFATSQRATAIEASVDDAEARIALTETAVTDGRFAAAQRVTTLEADFGGIEADVFQQGQVLVDLDTAFATLETEVSTQGVTVSQHATAIEQTEGDVITLLGKIGLSIDVNGRVVGLDIFNTGTLGLVKFLSDVFQIETPGGGPGLSWANGILWNRGQTQSILLGQGIGASQNLMMWAGPTPANPSGATKANGVFWIDATGDAYFGGSLSAGVLTNSNSTSLLANNASVTVGPFGTNGAPIVVVLSYSGSFQSAGFYEATQQGRNDWDAAVAAWGGVVQAGQVFGSKNGACTIRVELRKGATAVAMLAIDQYSETLSGYRPTPGDQEGYLEYNFFAGGSVTWTDNAGGTVDRTFTATIIQRDWVGPQIQRVGIIATEE